MKNYDSERRTTLKNDDAERRATLIYRDAASYHTGILKVKTMWLFFCWLLFCNEPHQSEQESEGIRIQLEVPDKTEKKEVPDKNRAAAADPVPIIRTSKLPDGLLADLKEKEESQLQSFLKVIVVQENGVVDFKGAGILGRVSFQDDRLLFRPKYPLVAGMQYEAELNHPTMKSPLRVRLSLPKVNRLPNARVQAIYPSGDHLPQNLLRIYILFSEPVEQGDAYRHIELSKADGKKLDYPFLELAEELWDPTGTRLTLLLDPARIKQGLVPREEDGPILEKGGRYQLVIRPDWPDAHGTPLAQGRIKKFQVIEDDTRQPSPQEWKIQGPPAASRSPLTIEFSEPLDYALGLRCIYVLGPNGERIDGEVVLSEQERRWTLTPTRSSWVAGKYELRIQSILEDACGNSVGRPFEVHLNDPVLKSQEPEVPFVSRRIEIR